jgi:hypothetical protein
MDFENTARGKYLSLKELNWGKEWEQLHIEELHFISYNIVLLYGPLFGTSLLDLTLLFEPRYFYNAECKMGRLLWEIWREIYAKVNDVACFQLAYSYSLRMYLQELRMVIRRKTKHLDRYVDWDNTQKCASNLSQTGDMECAF